jgi:hypothetical protein
MSKHGKKKNKEKASDRTMNVHQKRFVQFMKYLKKQDAKITVKHKDIRSGETFADVYSFDSKDLPMASLIAEACNIRESLASEYISRVRPLDDSHSHLLKVPGMGRIIHAIEFYFSSDKAIGQESIFNLQKNPYSIRNNNISCSDKAIDHESVFNLQNNPYSERDNNVSHSDNMSLKEVRKEFNDAKFVKESNFLTENLKYEFLEGFRSLTFNYNYGIYKHEIDRYYPFSDEINQLNNLHRHLKIHYIFNDEESEKLSSTFREYFILYLAQFPRLEKAMFLPGYLDFYIPYCKYDVFFQNLIKDNLEEIISNGIESTPKLDLINYRYEIIQDLKDKGTKVENWPVSIQALLLLTHYENIAIKRGVSSLSHTLIRDIRFIVYSSNKKSEVDVQQHNITLEELSLILRDYQFTKGLDNTFSVHDNQLLSSNLSRYPEHHAVKNLTLEDKIFECISEKVRESIIDNFNKNLYIT